MRVIPAGRYERGLGKVDGRMEGQGEGDGKGRGVKLESKKTVRWGEVRVYVHPREEEVMEEQGAGTGTGIGTETGTGTRMNNGT